MPMNQDEPVEIPLSVPPAGEQTPIKKALLALCAGEIDATEAVARFINADSCGASVSAFLHAHHLAMVAVKHCGVPASTSFECNGEPVVPEDGAALKSCHDHASGSWWFLNLYAPARKLKLNGMTLRLVEQCLEEATAVGLIEGTNGALTGILLHSDLRQEVEVMQSAGLHICRLLADLDAGQRALRISQVSLRADQARLDGELEVRKLQMSVLVKAFQKFKTERAVMHLVRFGVHLIPYAGGVIADGISGAAAVGELAKDFLGGGLGMVLEAQNLLGERVLVKAGEALEALTPEQEALVQGLVTELGIGGVDDLRQTFALGLSHVGELDEASTVIQVELIVREVAEIVAVSVEQVANVEAVVDSDGTNVGTKMRRMPQRVWILSSLLPYQI